MVTKLDSLVKATGLFSPQMGPVLFHGSGGEVLLQFGTSILEELLLNSNYLVGLSAAVSLLMEDLWLVMLVTSSTSGI